MSHQENGFILSVPVNDTGDLFEHTTGTWGEFRVDGSGNIGGVHEDEIPGIARDWVTACDAAIVGHGILKRAVEQGLISGDLFSLETYNEISLAYQGSGSEEKLQLIEGARKAFLALSDSSLEIELTPQDINAAERLVQSLDRYYKPRNIQPRQISRK